MKTFLLDLNAPVPSLLNGLKREIRKNIRRGDENLTLEVMGEEEYQKRLKAFKKTLGLTAVGYFAVPDRHLFAAKKGGELVCGQGIYFKEGRGIELALWRSEGCPYYASDWLKWNLLVFAKERGAKHYDFAGKQGYYKKKWGGFEWDDGAPEPKAHSLAFVRRALVKAGVID